MANTGSTRFRYLGTTDDVVDCERPGCTQVGLKSTVVIMPLDADGNDEGEPTYYGSVCAAKVLGVRGGGKAVLAAANGARLKTLMAAHDAASMLNLYNLPHTGELPFAHDSLDMTLLCQAYAQHNPGAARAALCIADVKRYVLDMLARKQAAIAEAVLVAGTGWVDDRQPLEYGYRAEIERIHGRRVA